jgi:hypothetical protein
MIKYAINEEIEVGSFWMSRNRRNKVSLDSIGTSIFRVDGINREEILVVRIALEYQGAIPFKRNEFLDNFIKIPPEHYVKMAQFRALLHQCVEARVSKEDIYNVVFEVEL